MEKYKSLSRDVMFKDTYLSSKAKIDSLLSDDNFIYMSTRMVSIENNDINYPIYSNFYNEMNEYLYDVDTKFKIEIISSDGILKYSNKLTVDETLSQPNQNTCPEIMASVNFVWGNPMINKTAFPIKPVYPDSVAQMVYDGYGISDRLIWTDFVNNIYENIQFVAKTWNGIKIQNGLLDNGPSPLFPIIMTIRISQNSL
jgi:hypothetical protein